MPHSWCVRRRARVGAHKRQRWEHNRLASGDARGVRGRTGAGATGAGERRATPALGAPDDGWLQRHADGLGFVAPDAT